MALAAALILTENNSFPFICLMENSHSILKAQSPNSLLQK
jgi:hypothetical protein